MRYDLKTPCKNCPFRTDIPAFLTKGRAKEIASSLSPPRSDQGGTFPCHKTTVPDDESDDGEMRVLPKSQHCAGALIMLAKSGRLHLNQTLLIMHRLGAFSPAALDLAAPVHQSAQAFIKAQPR